MHVNWASAQKLVFSKVVKKKYNAFTQFGKIFLLRICVFPYSNDIRVRIYCLAIALVSEEPMIRRSLDNTFEIIASEYEMIKFNFTRSCKCDSHLVFFSIPKNTSR